MHLVQMRVPHDSQDGILDTLDEADADYVITDAGSDNDSSIAYVPVPDGAVDEMLDRLQDDDLEDDIQLGHSPRLEFVRSVPSREFRYRFPRGDVTTEYEESVR